MVRYIVNKHGDVFPTKLNKLMFYADFYHYRKTGLSISGLQYLIPKRSQLTMWLRN